MFDEFIKEGHTLSVTEGYVHYLL